MRFNELRHDGERPFVLDLHPRLTLLAGLGDAGRQWMAALFQRALRGDLDGLTGTVDVHGVARQLTDALVAELQLPADLDIVVRAADLPGARTVVPAHAEIDLDDERDDDPLPDLRTLSNELAQARHALGRAAENRAHTEQLLERSRDVLAPEAADVAAAEGALAEARARREHAAAVLEAAVQRAPDDEHHRVSAARAELHERRADLEARRQRIMEALDGDPTSGVDPTAIADALAERKRWRPSAPQPVAEALDLAEELDRVEAELAALPAPPDAPPALLADGERELQAARQAVAEAEAILAERQVSPDDAARIDAAHDEVLDAEEKAERRLASPLAKKRYRDALDAEARVLRELGFSSYSDYLLSTSTLVADPGAARRLGEARRRLLDAEAVWDELTGGSLREQREHIEERQVELLKRARDLFGGQLPDTDVAHALRELRTSPDDGPDDRPLVEALRAAGVEVDPGTVDLVAVAEHFLTDADEGHARRAALQAELSTVADDLADVQRELAALPPTTDLAGDATASELDAARDALRLAQEDEQRAHRLAVEARAAAAEHRAALQRIEALEGDLAGAHAAEQQASAHVARLEAAIADAEAHHEQRRRARQAAAEKVNAVIDLTDVERAPTEVYLLARVAAQRDVGQAGSVPLVLADALNGLSVETTQGVLDVIERFAPVVQFILMSDDPNIEEWARSFGPEGAAVRRFSFVAAGA